MHSPLARIARRTGRAAQRMLSQIIVSVAAAISVAIITNAYLDQRTTDAAANVAEAGRVIAEQPNVEPAAKSGLPPLETVTVVDRPIHGAPTPDAEIFPGVAADGPLAKAVAVTRESEEPRERRFFGFRLPFSATAG